MDIYLIIVVVLMALAVSDLIFGVGNDAVNFLNSAVGSKVAPIKIILLIASVGVLIGATFSSGLMEVARKGIFHPDQFHFSEIMVIFLAVMVTDIILLDMFNTFGLPTSTTVSIVFELLGSAVAVSIIKIYRSDETMLDLGKYINSEKALAIISGILLSVIVAFVVGALVQYLSRLLFSFNFSKRLKYFGSIWGGLAIVAITYFMLIKGAKGASFLTEEKVKWIATHTWHIVIYGFIGWTIVLQILNWLFKISIPKVIVLVGTFALAMAFAGNDLVNFIGVPLAGLKSYQAYMAAPGAMPDDFLMGALAKPVITPTYLLLIAGVVMILTLWFNKKARSVIATTINLSRQGGGDERFGSSLFSRSIVRSSLAINKTIRSIIPVKVTSTIDKQFYIPKADLKKSKSKDAASFDLIRASVNLVVASVLIAFGTSLKLPLSTTYVTFMVAMGTSLADRAWGRESAVYRIQGVFSVIGGWFLTAFSAFLAAFILANIIYWGGIIAITIILLIAVYFIYRTNVLHTSREKEKDEENKELEIIEEIINASNIFEKCRNHTLKLLYKIPAFYENLIEGLASENRQQLKDLDKDVNKFNKKTKKVKDNVNETVIKLQADQIDTGHYYVQSVDYIREIAHSMNFIVSPCFKHIDNNHTGLNPAQVKEMQELRAGINELFKLISSAIDNRRFDGINVILEKQHNLLELLAEIRKNQIKRIKADDIHPRTSLLYLDILAETKNLLLYSVNLLKSQRDFILEIGNE